MDAQGRFVGRPIPRRRTSLSLIAAAFAVVACAPAAVARADDPRVAALEAELAAARAKIVDLESTLSTLAADVAALKSEPGASQQPEEELAGAQHLDADQESGDSESAWRKQILVPDLAADERETKLTGRPTLFVQAGYEAKPIDGATREDAPTNFTVNRLEMNWAGSVNERLGMGFEIQYQPALTGASEELVNDAFIEYYATDSTTVRFGQFVKPFGFEVQQSSSARESPERAMFSGYFFPGERDRGAMVATDLSRFGGGWSGMTVAGALLNGNRFFDDNNAGLNVNLRVRKVFESRPFAIGASFQSGSQLLPPGAVGSDHATIYGVDAQWVFGRLGIRAEYVRGDMPSTLLGLEPDFAPGFAPGQKTSGATASFHYRVTANDAVYWRSDRLTNDPVTRADIHAFNVGYLRSLGEKSRIGVDYQWKSDVSSNDDKVNTQLALRWNLVY